MKSLDLKDINLAGLARKITKPIIDHQLILICIIILGSLIYVVYGVNQALSTPENEEYRTQQEQQTVKTNFSSETIEKIENLKDSDQNAELILPNGRLNPFHE